MEDQEKSTQNMKTVAQKDEGMTFAKTFLASLLGFFAGLFGLAIFSTIGFMLLVSSIASIESESYIADEVVLRLKLDGPFPEIASASSLDQIFSDEEIVTVRDVVEALDYGARDERVKGVWLDFGNYSGSVPQIEVFHRALTKFKSSDKFVYATSNVNGLGEGAYVLASVADSIFLQHSAGVELNGLYIMLEFYKPLLDKLHIKPIVIRAGSYKSAVEPFTRTSASDENREAITSLIDGQYNRLKTLLAARSNMAAEKIDSLVEQYPVLRAGKALELGIVDRLVYGDELESPFKIALFGLDSTKRLRTVSPTELLKDVDPEENGSTIAVVYANGAITTGESTYSPNPLFGGEMLGSDSFVKNMREARKDDRVEGVVIRVNSPGGELGASIAMWREVVLTSQVKPVIVSMGSIAASGGYYISAPADEIFAEESTITGSIGVFALAMNMKGLFEETIGIETEVIKTGPHADILSGMRDLETDEVKFATEVITEVYEEFLQIVADGRSLDVSDVDSVAQGRVWTGIEAKERGLVDSIGGLESAIERCAELAEVESFDVRLLPKPKNKIELLFDFFQMTGAKASLITPEGYAKVLREDLTRMSTPQARLLGFNYIDRHDVD